MARRRLLLVQTYRTEFGDEPVQAGVNYWFYDSHARKFRVIFFSNNGPYSEEGNRYEGEIAEGTLTFTGPARFQYDLDADGRVRLNKDGTADRQMVAARREWDISALDDQRVHQK